jgi:hypothetical protein
MTLTELEVASLCNQLAHGNATARTALLRTVADADHGTAFLDEVADARLPGAALAGLWALAGCEPKPFATLVWHEAAKARDARRTAA